MHEFTAQRGTGARCQIGNLRLAHLIIFGWPGRVFGYRNAAAETATHAAA